MLTKTKARVRQIKTKIQENPEETFMYTLIGSMTVLFTVATVYAVKEENRIARETEEWVRNENSKGNSVYRLADGSLLAVPTPEYVNQF